MSVPLHSSSFGRRIGRGECPISEHVSATLLRLPFYTDMTDGEMDLVVDALVEASA
jgi:dTDP-4-amino-4,6-dideoxygalactose transaminase